MKKSTPLRILVVGGSTVFDTGVTDDESTWCFRLQKELEIQYPSVEVINAGIPVYGLWDNFLKYCLYDYQVRPDVVIIYQGVNDTIPRIPKSLSGILKEDYWMYRGIAAREWSGINGKYTPLQNEINSIFNYSVLFMGGYNKRGSNGNLFKEMMIAKNSDDVLPDGILSNDLTILKDFISVLRSEGVILFFIPQTMGAKSRKNVSTNFPVWIQALNKLNASYIQNCQKMSTPVIDVRNVGDTWGDEYFKDELHFNDKGAYSFAHLITSDLIERPEILNLYEKNKDNHRNVPNSIDILRK